MRKYLAIAAAVAVTVGLASGAVADEGNLTLTAKITPKKLDVKKYSDVSLNTVVAIRPDPGAEAPPAGTQTIIDFPKNMKVDADAVPACKKSLEGLVPEDAMKACGKSEISLESGTSGEVAVGAGRLDAVVLGFRGATDAELILYTYQPDFGLTTILPGKFTKSGAGKAYGMKLIVEVPPLAGGAAAISRFELTTDKKTGYVLGRCKSKTNEFQATGFYTGHAKEVDTFSTKCKQKG